jgi:hypothetical protein
MPDFPDTVALVGVDMTTRAVDTVGHIKIAKTKLNIQQTEKGIIAMSEINPMQTLDDWAVLSNGTVALVRGQDYHVDFIGADGAITNGPKIPFDWQHLSDSDKVAVIDSARTAIMAATAKGNAAAAAPGAPAALAGAALGGQRTVINFSTSGGGGGPISTVGSTGPAFNFVSPSELPDYRPAFTANATRADLDGNLWIRTTAMRAGTVAGGPIYDVVDSKGALVDRIQVPAGRLVVGFGKTGVVYMLARDDQGAWLERTRR